MRAASLFLLTLAGVSALPAASADQFEVHLAAGEMVRMRDGIRLATDVYLPARAGQPAEGRFPVILFRTPYNKAGVKGEAEYFARRGYAVVAQDCRGRFASEGEFYPFLNEGQDGYDAIEWAAAQPWSNGKVGTNGGSYLAWDQYHAAMYRPPHLVAMFAIVGGANFLDEFAHPGGAPNLGWPMWILGSAASSPPALRDAAAREPLLATMKNPGPWLALDPQKRGEIFRAFPVHERIYRDFYTHTEFDDYWRQRGFFIPGYHKEMKDVSVFFISGWYDYFAEGVLENFAALARLQKAPKKLWMGPWPHGIGGASCGNANFGRGAAVPVREIALDWFDYWLKGDPLEQIGPEPVRLFRMGGGDGSRDPEGRLRHGGEWRTADAWPPRDVHPAKYHLREGGLFATAPGPGKPAGFTFDPDNPVPTIGGRFGVGPWTPNCAQNQVCSPKILGCADSKPLRERPDVLSFASPPLEQPLEVTGKIRARLWISSDAPDTDFTAKLIDVYPDGYALIVADGQIRTRYRKGRTRAELMKPGEVYPVAIDLGSTSSLFAKGHRIRVDVSSSNFPRIEPNPNTGEAAWSWTRRVRAHNTLYLDARRPSHIELPVR